MAVIFNLLLFAGCYVLYAQVTGYPGNHWLWFGTETERFLAQWFWLVVSVLALPNLVFALLYFRCRRVMIGFVMLGLAGVSATAVYVVLQLALD